MQATVKSVEKCVKDSFLLAQIQEGGQKPGGPWETKRAADYVAVEITEGFYRKW